MIIQISTYLLLYLSQIIEYNVSTEIAPTSMLNKSLMTIKFTNSHAKIEHIKLVIL